MAIVRFDSVSETTLHCAILARLPGIPFHRVAPKTKSLPNNQPNRTKTGQ